MQMKHLNTSARDSTVCGFLSLATSELVAIPLGPGGKCQQLINTQMSDTICKLDTWDRRGARSIFVSLSHDAPLSDKIHEAEAIS